MSVWLNKSFLSKSAIRHLRGSLQKSSPRHLVIDGLFNNMMLDSVLSELQTDAHWKTQKHTYSALYVEDETWQSTIAKALFVKRDVWQPEANNTEASTAQTFLSYLRSPDFMRYLSALFQTLITDMNVSEPAINTNYFRLKDTDFVNQHADDSPGRVVCMLLYMNKGWHANDGGELVFMGTDNRNINIEPLYNRCVLFDPASPGSEHWVKAASKRDTAATRYNVTSWYWTE